MPLQIIRQDITKMCVDAIVNSTNEEMIGYSGVDLLIHKAAGPLLDLECSRLAPLILGSAKITKGYLLDAKYIIHTSGPIWRGGNEGESETLRSCYLESLKLAAENGCESIAFPLISSGVYGFPKDQVLKFAIQVITEFLFENEMTVYLCVFDRTSYEFSKKLFDEIRDFIDADDGGDELCGELCADLILPDETRRGGAFSAPMASKAYNEPKRKKTKPSLSDFLNDIDKPFAYKLFELIDLKGMTDVECYKKANVDKKTFSKIKCNPQTYKPSKQTAVAFAIALRLSVDETQALLASAGLTLSPSFVFDRIILYFLLNEEYDIFEINEALFEFDQVLLGC